MEKAKQVVCQTQDLIPNSGVCALVNGKQVALFYFPEDDQPVRAVSNWDPIGQANVLSRGIVGDLKGRLVVASPLYKQHFDLKTGECLEDDQAKLEVFPVSIEENLVLWG